VHARRKLEHKVFLRSWLTTRVSGKGRAAHYFFTNGVINSTPHVGDSLFQNNNAKFLPQPRIGDFASTEEAVLLLQISESRLGHFASIRRLPN